MNKGHKETISTRFISRNLRFQCINTPLVSLLICLYRHFAMSELVEGNRLSPGNYLETLVIIAFLSFAIGLYWCFKFRSTYWRSALERAAARGGLGRCEGLHQVRPSRIIESAKNQTNSATPSTVSRYLFGVFYCFNFSGTTGIAPFWVQTKALTATAVL